MFVNNRNLSEEKAGFFLVITKKNNSKAIVLKYNKFFLSMKKQIFVGQKCLYFMPKLLSEK